MILQYLTKVEDENGVTLIENVESVRDNVTSVSEFDDKIEVTFSRPSGKFDLVTFDKPHGQIYNMWLLNDNFKTLKRLI